MFKTFEGSMQNFETLLNEEGYKLVTFVATPSGVIAAVFEVAEPSSEDKLDADTGNKGN